MKMFRDYLENVSIKYTQYIQVCICVDLYLVEALRLCIYKEREREDQLLNFFKFI